METLKPRDKFLSKNKIIFKKFRPLYEIGKGTFSTVYLATTIKTGQNVAIKVEQRNGPESELLENEAFLLYRLKGFGIPEVISFGRTKLYNILVEPLLGISILDLFEKKNRKIDIKDICLIAIQLIQRIQWVHSKFIVYRDIKPENFLFGKKDPEIIYIIDFGLCEKYRSTKTGKHILPKNIGKFTGTSRYASLYAMEGNVQSRRDDIESIGYMLIFLMKTKLPWQGIKGTSQKECYQKLYLMKKYMPLQKLCYGLPKEIIHYLKYAKSLKFEQKPDYDYLINLFKVILEKVSVNNIIIYKFSFLNNDKSDNQNKGINCRKSSPQSRIYNQLKKSMEMKTNKNFDNMEGGLLRNRSTFQMGQYTNNLLKIKKQINDNNTNNSSKILNNFDDKNRLTKQYSSSVMNNYNKIKHNYTMMIEPFKKNNEVNSLIDTSQGRISSFLSHISPEKAINENFSGDKNKILNRYVTIKKSKLHSYLINKKKYNSENRHNANLNCISAENSINKQQNLENNIQKHLKQRKLNKNIINKNKNNTVSNIFENNKIMTTNNSGNINRIYKQKINYKYSIKPNKIKKRILDYPKDPNIKFYDSYEDNNTNPIMTNEQLKNNINYNNSAIINKNCFSEKYDINQELDKRNMKYRYSSLKDSEKDTKLKKRDMLYSNDFVNRARNINNYNINNQTINININNKTPTPQKYQSKINQSRSLNKNNMISTLKKFNLSNTTHFTPTNNSNNIVNQYNSFNNSLNMNPHEKITKIEAHTINYSGSTPRLNKIYFSDKKEIYHSSYLSNIKNINKKNLKESFSEANYFQKKNQQRLINNKNENKLNDIDRRVNNMSNINNISNSISFGLSENEDEKKINNYNSNVIMNDISKYSFATKNNYQNFIFDYTDENCETKNNNIKGNYIRNISNIKLLPWNINSKNSPSNSSSKEKGRINNYVINRTKVKNFSNING